MRVVFGSAKTSKQGAGESGDTLEVVERRKGGFSVVIADGQGSGPSAKRISAMVVSRTIGLISEGVRDGAAARAAHDFLFALRDGKVSCELIIVSADHRTREVVVSRNSHVPVLVRTNDRVVAVLAGEVEPLGIHEIMRPSIEHFPMVSGSMVLAMTDGIIESGSRTGRRVEMPQLVRLLEEADPSNPQALADAVLAHGMEVDGGRTMDDMCAAVMSVVDEESVPKIRRLSVDFPI
jgi:serine phosphatase RsbU (regulator of sigma subunit)